MQIAASNLPYQGLFTNRLIRLPEDIGVEVYSETGSDFYWNHLLPRLLKDRIGPFSVHGPYQNIDLSSNTLDYEEVKEFYRWTFRLCEKFGSRHCVCHPYAYKSITSMSAVEIDTRRELCLNRVVEISREAEKYGVTLLVENMADYDGLFSQEDFLNVFGGVKELRFLIDTGHANIQRWDIDMMFGVLGERILGYHLNDNFGDADSHLKVFEGTFDWKTFFARAMQITPDAVYVCEYMNTDVEEITESVQKIRQYAAEQKLP